MARRRLREVLDRVAAARSPAPVVVFDLDSTLFSTWPRSVAILRRFVAEHGADHPELARAAASIRPEDERWSVIEVLRGHRAEEPPAQDRQAGKGPGRTKRKTPPSGKNA